MLIFIVKLRHISEWQVIKWKGSNFLDEITNLNPAEASPTEVVPCPVQGDVEGSKVPGFPVEEFQLKDMVRLGKKNYLTVNILLG
jgi:hypothetical protein